VSVNQTQEEIDANMRTLIEKNDQRFQGIGKAKVESIHIETDPKIKRIQQK